MHLPDGKKESISRPAFHRLIGFRTRSRRGGGGVRSLISNSKTRKVGWQFAGVSWS